MAGGLFDFLHKGTRVVKNLTGLPEKCRTLERDLQRLEELLQDRKREALRLGSDKRALTRHLDRLSKKREKRPVTFEPSSPNSKSYRALPQPIMNKSAPRQNLLPREHVSYSPCKEPSTHDVAMQMLWQ